MIIIQSKKVSLCERFDSVIVKSISNGNCNHSCGIIM